MSAEQKPPRPRNSGDAVTDRIADAMVGVAGTHGYEVTTVDAICARAEVSRVDFEDRFSSLEECYAYAYDRIATRFAEDVLDAYNAHTSWHDKVWAAGWASIGFLREDPRRARFFAVEVNNAGPRAQLRRDRVMQVFADLIDAGRGELENPGSLTRATAEMVSGAIYFTIQNKILEGSLDRGEDFLVELVYIAVLPYLGASTAEAELRVQSLREMR